MEGTIKVDLKEIKESELLNINRQGKATSVIKYLLYTRGDINYIIL